jgi:hypothetical protein
MWRYLAGGVSALLLVTAGFLFFRSGARPDQPLFGPPPQAPAAQPTLPAAAPAATEKTREQKRFDRYDKDRDGIITRDEYLASRRKAFARLDTDHDGRLSFEEWAIRTTGKFAHADADHSGALNAAEFLTTRVVRKPKPKCACPAAKADGD